MAVMIAKADMAFVVMIVKSLAVMIVIKSVAAISIVIAVLVAARNIEVLAVTNHVMISKSQSPSMINSHVVTSNLVVISKNATRNLVQMRLLAMRLRKIPARTSHDMNVAGVDVAIDAVAVGVVVVTIVTLIAISKAAMLRPMMDRKHRRAMIFHRYLSMVAIITLLLPVIADRMRPRQ